MINTLICGVNGAMGKVLVDCINADENINIVLGFDSEDKGNYPFNIVSSLEDIKEQIDLIIDFSHFSVTETIVKFAKDNKIPLVCATTGLNESTIEYIENISMEIPIFRSNNFSYGISVLKKLVSDATKLLSDSYDIEIVGKHHNKKVDAPSGTAFLLLDEIIKSTDKNYDILTSRSGKDTKRKKDEITIHAIRGGTIVGEHNVIFAGEDEIIEISHSATSKKVFAMGAIKAGKYIINKKNGLYNMDHIVKGDINEL